VYDADSFSNWLKKFFTTGVFEGDCQVTALGDMVVNLAPGYANIMGKVKNLENQTFTLEPADGSYPRIDTIVIERNDTDRDITAKVVTGQLSGNTPAPTPRVWENGVYQLIVAEVYVAAGATEVTQADITDKRSDPDVCGIVAGTVTEMDFSQFTAQFESYFEQFKASNLEEFSEWFEMIKGQLSEDAAGHLQNEIDDINEILGDGLIASNINYDNTHSGMTATKVQGAIDEINDNLLRFSEIQSTGNFAMTSVGSNVVKTLTFELDKVPTEVHYVQAGNQWVFQSTNASMIAINDKTVTVTIICGCLVSSNTCAASGYLIYS
jgi:hypothetical protein